MITSLFLAATMMADTTVTISRTSRDMQLGRDKVTIDLQAKAVQLGCSKYSIAVPTLEMEGSLYKWTGTLTCTR